MQSKELRLLAGNPSRRPIRDVRTLASGTPQCPAWLSPEAKAEWQRVTSLLSAAGILSHLDAAGIADYSICVARLSAAERDIEERGLLIQGERGSVKNPSVQIAREYRASLRAWCDLFGLAPLPRGRMKVPDEPGHVSSFGGVK